MDDSFQRHVEAFSRMFKESDGETHANGEAIDWPKCDRCDRVMDIVPNDEDRIVKFQCPVDGFFLTFPSCRKKHRKCAWDILNPIRIREDVVL